MKIGIIETKSHYIYLYSLCRIFNTEENELYLFVNKSLNKQMEKMLKEDYHKFNWIVKKEGKANFEFFKRIKRNMKRKIDLLFLNTIQHNYFSYIYLLSGLNCQKILTIHNINNWFDPDYNFSPKDLARILTRNIIFKLIDNINVYGENLRNYIIENFNYQNKVFTIPFTIYEKKEIKRLKEDEVISFVVPGRVRKKRRDYKLVLRAFKKLFNKYGEKISLILLGQPYGEYGKEVLKKCNQLEKEGYNITYYTKYISENEFEKKLLTSNIILAPTNRTIYYANTKEVYGKSKETGATFMMARYSKPGIIPSNINPPMELADSILQYRDEKELRMIIKKVIENKSFREKVSKKAQVNSKQLSVNSVRNEFWSKFK